MNDIPLTSRLRISLFGDQPSEEIIDRLVAERDEAADALDLLMSVEAAARDYAQWSNLSSTTKNFLGRGGYEHKQARKFEALVEALEQVCPLGDLPAWSSASTVPSGGAS